MRPEMEKVVSELEKVIAGKRDVIGKILMALLADGHILLDDVPGVGKTTLAVAISRAIGLVYQPGALNHANLLLGDEINRASSKTQSALLEAMEERQLTVDGVTYPLEKPFLVIATQNSVGTSGTQWLPFAQVDRFLVRLSLGYPDYEAQMAMLRDRQGANPLDQVQCVLTREALLGMQQTVQHLTTKDSILDYITRLTMASRTHPRLEAGISPRGALFLDRMAKAHAWMDGRDYVTGNDVQAVFMDVCAHRILLRDPTEGISAEQVLNELLRDVENPDHHSRLGGLLKR